MALWSVSKHYYYVSHDTKNCTKTVQLIILQMKPDNSIQFEQKSQCVSKHVAAVLRLIVLNYVVLSQVSLGPSKLVEIKS